ncbi:unnamed protein product [Periconia digitata]|uniref:Uncharacterized protein n=1 Tax=Periconia digitata TaxID=1303443 RepID=A0A9W4XWN6_9PLEO|nr:unnamed protein product [Periconia digitata]
MLHSEHQTHSHRQTLLPWPPNIKLTPRLASQNHKTSGSFHICGPAKMGKKPWMHDAREHCRTESYGPIFGVWSVLALCTFNSIVRLNRHLLSDGTCCACGHLAKSAYLHAYLPRACKIIVTV